jgi:hypothetical protein
LIPSEVVVSTKRINRLDEEIHKRIDEEMHKKNFKKLPEFSAAERTTHLRRRMPLD